jgi:hypothetical protein
MTAGERVYVVGLSVASEGLALLTLGLVRPWGETLPRRLPLLDGRRSRPGTAVAAAASGVVALTTLTTYVVLNLLVFHIKVKQTIGNDNMLPGGAGRWLLAACYLQLLAWPVLLAVLTVDYRRRHPAPLSPPAVRVLSSAAR